MDKPLIEQAASSEQTRQATAFHEAGHAVIGRKMKLACGEATIIPDANDGSLGGAIIANPLRDWERGEGPRRALADAFCIALFAGAEAERLLSPAIHCGDDEDRRRVTGVLSDIGVSGASYVGDDIWERYEGRLQRRARDLVRVHRIEIGRVAQALIERGTLPADEVIKAPYPRLEQTQTAHSR